MNKARKHPSPLASRPDDAAARKSVELKNTSSRSAVTLRNARKSPSNIHEGAGTTSGLSATSESRCG